MWCALRSYSMRRVCLAGRPRQLQQHRRLATSLPNRFENTASGASVGKDKKLFTPGPLATSLSVKSEMLRDLGSRDIEFIDTVKAIRQGVLDIAGVDSEQYTAIPVQGSGTFAVEAALTTSVPKKDPLLLVIRNGAYGQRLTHIAASLDVPIVDLPFPETQMPDLEVIKKTLEENPSITNVAAVHCETSCGIINPVHDIGNLVKSVLPDACYVVDAMSSFGAVPFDMVGSKADYMVTSANKCIQGVPGFSLVVARTAHLMGCKGNSRSLSLDLVGQHIGLEESGQFRFTPATHAMLAFRQALRELEAEGGPEARAARYQANKAVLIKNMKEMGFKELLDPKVSGYIITSYRFPDHPSFDFKEFYNRLNDRDLVIYPGKVTEAECFRIGTIGEIYPEDVENLIVAIKEVSAEMGMELPLTS